MSYAAVPAFIAVDVGNSRIKLGRFARTQEGVLPEPVAVLELPITGSHGGKFATRGLDAWCSEHAGGGAPWLIASVNQRAAQLFSDALGHWAQQQHIECAMRPVTYREVRLTIRVAEPDTVGIDRLLSALAANRLRQRGRAAIIIDAGTAITVDLLEPDAAFAGGAILPGISMSARALAEYTDALPHIATESLGKWQQVPGKSTTEAIAAGLQWGAVGGIRELVAQISATQRDRPDVFLTGGASWHIKRLLDSRGDGAVRHLPHLVLSGIALTMLETVAKEGSLSNEGPK